MTAGIDPDPDHNPESGPPASETDGDGPNSGGGDGRDRSRFPARPALGWPGYLRRLAMLIGVSALAVTQPLLATFGDSPETLIILEVDRLIMIATILVIALVPAGVAWMFETAADRLHPTAGMIARALTLGLFLGLAISLLAQQVVGYSPPMLWVCLAVGVGLAAAADRTPIAGEWISYLALGQLAFASMFLFSSPGGSVVMGRSVPLPDEPSGADDTPVVMVMFDEMPITTMLDGSGRINAESFPGFARLAGSATWYRNATTVAPNTTQAIPAIVTGMLPTDLGAAPTAGDHDQSLFTLLGSTHDTTSFEQMTRLCPPNVCETQRAGSRRQSFAELRSLLWPTYVDIVTDVEGGTLLVDPPYDTEAPARLDQFIEQLDGAPGSLDVIHSMFPHGPYLYEGDGTRYDAPYVPRAIFYKRWLDDAAALLGRQRHTEQARLADAKIDELITHLVDTGSFDDTLIIVVADHGISFRGGEPDRGLSEANGADIAWVPMFVKYPGQTDGTVDDRAAETIDIVPTIADVVGATAPWETDGRSLLGPEPPADSPARLADWARSVIHPEDGLFSMIDRPTGFATAIEATPISPEVPGPAGAFALVPGLGDLLGRRVDDLEVGEPIAETAVLEERYADRTWDGTAPAPLYLSGSIPRPPDEPIAVAVDGEVAAVAPTSIFQGFEQTSWWTLIPADAVPIGSHELDLYLVDDTVDPPVLHPMAMRPG